MSGVAKFVIFSLGERRCAVVAADVAELAVPQPVQTFPHTSREILGVIVRRGRVVPVYDFAGLVAARGLVAQQYQLIAICRGPEGDQTVALPVDGECDLISAELLQVKQPRPGLTGELRWREQTYEVLDLNKLIPMASAR